MSYPPPHEELGPSVMLLARVTNRDFSEDMRDSSSTTYRSFVDEFSRTVRASLCPPHVIVGPPVPAPLVTRVPLSPDGPGLPQCFWLPWHPGPDPEVSVGMVVEMGWVRNL